MAWYSGLFGSDSLGGKLSFGIGSWLNDISGQSSSAKKQYQNELKLQKDAQNFNANQAQIERDWQTQMSNTAHQRAVSDLQSAGLNPVLSANNGADASAGATASSGIGSASAGNSPTDMLTNIVGMLNSSKQTDAIVDKTKSEIENIDADTANKKQEYELQPAEVQSIIELNKAQSAKARAEKAKIVAEKMAVEFNNKMREMDVDKRTQQWDKELDVYKHQMTVALIEAGVDDSTAGMIIRQIGKSVNAFSPFTGFIPNGGNTYNFTQSAPTVNY